MSDVRALLKERDTQYAEAWRKTGVLMKLVRKEVDWLLDVFPEGYYNWVIILNKLLRILGDARHIDSWKDIAGYATLVVEYLENEKEIRDEIPTSRS